MSIHLDVTSEDDWCSVVDQAGSKYGKLDILVNNAGMTIPKPLEETTADDWDRTSLWRWLHRVLTLGLWRR